MDKIILKENERLDDLQYNDLKLIQDKNGFCFGTDSVEIANFVKAQKNQKACDLGAGNGIISILIAKKQNLLVTAVEVQKNSANLIEKNIILNGLSDKIKVLNCKMQDLVIGSTKGEYDIVVTNPPYSKVEAGFKCSIDNISIARQEVLVTLAEVIATASHLVKFGGDFYIVHKIERLAEVITLCTNNLLEPKILQILTPNKNKKPHLFMLKATKNGKAGLIVLSERAVGGDF